MNEYAPPEKIIQACWKCGGSGLYEGQWVCHPCHGNGIGDTFSRVQRQYTQVVSQLRTEIDDLRKQLAEVGRKDS